MLVDYVLLCLFNSCLFKKCTMKRLSGLSLLIIFQTDLLSLWAVALKVVAITPVTESLPRADLFCQPHKPRKMRRPLRHSHLKGLARALQGSSCLWRGRGRTPRSRFFPSVVLRRGTCKLISQSVLWLRQIMSKRRYDSEHALES